MFLTGVNGRYPSRAREYGRGCCGAGGLNCAKAAEKGRIRWTPIYMEGPSESGARPGPTTSLWIPQLSGPRLGDKSLATFTELKHCCVDQLAVDGAHGVRQPRPAAFVNFASFRLSKYRQVSVLHH